MGKYTDAEINIFSLMKTTGLPTYPAAFKGEKGPAPYLRFTIVPSGPQLNAASSSGLLLVEIFTVWGEGPSPSTAIADMLDVKLQRKTVGTTQLFTSSLDKQEQDKDNPGLARVIYSLPYSHFGVN